MGVVVVIVAVVIVVVVGVFDEGRLTKKKVRKLQMQNSGRASWVLEAIFLFERGKLKQSLLGGVRFLGSRKFMTTKLKKWRKLHKSQMTPETTCAKPFSKVMKAGTISGETWLAHQLSCLQITKDILYRALSPFKRQMVCSLPCCSK